MQTSDWISAAGVIVAVAALAWSARSDRRAKAAGAAAAEARERSADALNKAADALTRSSEADDRSADALAAVRDEITKLLPPQRVSWDLSRLNGSRYALKNVGNATAIDVQLDLGNRRVGAQPPRRRMDQEDSMVFSASSATQADLIVVWRDEPDGELRTQALPFPSRIR